MFVILKETYEELKRAYHCADLTEKQLIEDLEIIYGEKYGKNILENTTEI